MSDQTPTKTVNFIEALEANKTKRVRTKKGGWYDVEQLRKSQSEIWAIIGIIESMWEVEPEVIECECEWDKYFDADEVIYAPFISDLSKEVIDKLRLLVIKGTKTRVRIEVL